MFDSTISHTDSIEALRCALFNNRQHGRVMVYSLQQHVSAYNLGPTCCSAKQICQLFSLKGSQITHMLYRQLFDHLLPHLTPAAAAFSRMSLSESHIPIATLQVQDDTVLSAVLCHLVRCVAGDHTRQGSAVDIHMHAQDYSGLETYHWMISLNKQLSNHNTHHDTAAVIVTTMRRRQQRSKQTYRK